MPSGKQHLSLRSAPPLFFPLGISPTLQSPAFSSRDLSQTLPRYGRFVCACARVFACAKFVRFEACARARAVRVLDTRSVLSVCLSPSSPLRAAAGARADPLTLSRPLFLRLSLFAAATGGLWMDCVYLHS